MLNPFPIQFLALLAYLILRTFVGGMFFYFGIQHINHRKEIGQIVSFPLFGQSSLLVWCLVLIEIIVGLMFLVGFYTQIAALISMVFCLKLLLFYTRFVSQHFPSKIFYVLLFASSLSLFITGAGAFAFDLPI